MCFFAVGPELGDVRSDSCYDMPYDNMLPLGYDSWYVPHMNDAMPSYIDLDRGECRLTE